jgi:aminobutyraldehyde dehydrogenase
MTSTTRKTMAFKVKLLINGESVDGDGDSLAVQNPSTGSTICEVAEATAEQVEATVRAARDA